MQYSRIGQRVVVLDAYRNTLEHDECYWTGTITQHFQHGNDYLVVFDNGDEDCYQPNEIRPVES